MSEPKGSSIIILEVNEPRKRMGCSIQWLARKLSIYFKTTSHCNRTGRRLFIWYIQIIEILLRLQSMFNPWFSQIIVPFQKSACKPVLIINWSNSQITAFFIKKKRFAGIVFFKKMTISQNQWYEYCIYPLKKILIYKKPKIVGKQQFLALIQ